MIYGTHIRHARAHGMYTTAKMKHIELFIKTMIKITSKPSTNISSTDSVRGFIGDFERNENDTLFDEF